MMSVLRYGWIPFIAVIAFFLLQLQVISVPASVSAQLPYLLLGSALVLSLYFQLSRVAFACGTFLMAFGALGGFAPDIAGAQFELTLLVLATGIALFSIGADRSVYSAYGVFLLAAVALQGGLLLALFHVDNAWLIPWVDYDVLSLLPRGSYELLHEWVGDLAPADLLLATAVMAVCIVAGVVPGYVSLGLVGIVLLICAVYRFGISSVESALVCAGVLLVLVALRSAYELAFRDELTGIPSRRAYSRYLLTLGRSYSIAVIDIDHFKKLNDRYGHQVGDQALRMVASKIARHGGGRAFRYGGEEFVVVLRGRDRAKAERSLERMREEIAGNPLRLRSAARPKNGGAKARRKRGQGGGKSIKTTVSVGIATSGAKLRSPDEVLQAADRALYKAKRAGRNRVCVHG